MSTMKEIADSKVTIALKPKEGFLQSLYRDLVTFSLLGFCIYIGMGSKFWTLVTGLLFLGFLWVKLSSILSKSTTTFSTKKAAINFIENCEDLD